ncbi:MAG: type II secretion system secretin GspD [Bryobacteraceae bacterium]|nr:type II secretion system secretin GspD [Bryobacteraceae bacterium]
MMRAIEAPLALGLTLLLLPGPYGWGQEPPPLPPIPKGLPQGFGPQSGMQQMPQPAPQAPKPKPGEPDAAAQQPPAGAPVSAPAASLGGLNLQNVSLVEVIDYLARELKLNYIIDPEVKGSVTLNTYGEVRDIDPRELLDTILRINGYAMVQMGTLHRIVPLAQLNSMPLRPSVDAADIPEDDRAMLNLVFLKYANAEELSKLLNEFLGAEGRTWSYPAANLLLILDSRRSMKRTMDLVTMFDSDALARQRVRLFEVKHSRPSDLADELEDLMKSISMGKDLSSIRFVPVDRINLLIAVAPNPGVFQEVETWLAKLDVKAESAVGRTDTYVYRVRYGRADMLAFAIMSLYYSMNPGMGGFGMGMMGMGGMGMGGFGFGGMGMGGMGMGGIGMGGMGGIGMGQMGMGGMGMGGVGMGQMGMGGMGMGGMMPGMMNPQMMMPGSWMGPTYQTRPQAAAGEAGSGESTRRRDRTGEYLGDGAAAGYGGMPMMQGPRVVPNIMDNSLLILATGEEYQAILKLLRDLDVPPRQVLIEARIYEVALTGSLSNGIAAFLRRRGEASGAASTPGTRQVVGAMNDGLSLSAGMLIGQSRELLAFLTSAETRTRARVISAPTVIATDSIPAAINVGIEVPMLQSQAVTGGIQDGSSLFANTITNRRTGVSLAIVARVNPSGVVTLEIDQEVSAPQPPPAGSAIQSPSFSQRTIKTQITVQDNDMIAIGGIINESSGDSNTGVPFLTRVPGFGALFSSRAYTRERTELVIFLTPRVIRDTNEMLEATEELKSGMKRLQRMMRN